MGPIALLPALFLFCFVVTWRIADRRPRLGRPSGEPSDAAGHLAPEEVDGFEGTALLAQKPGGRLTARLVPLQALSQWQAFDADALARRLDLPGGEPWRLELVYEAAEGGAERLALDLGETRVAAAGEPLLAPLVGQVPAAPDGAPADPLRALFAARPAALASGAAAELVLWGRAPSPDAPPRVAIGAVAIELVPVRVKSRDLPRSIARLSEPGPGSGAR